MARPLASAPWDEATEATQLRAQIAQWQTRQNKSLRNTPPLLPIGRCAMLVRANGRNCGDLTQRAHAGTMPKPQAKKPMLWCVN